MGGGGRLGRSAFKISSLGMKPVGRPLGKSKIVLDKESHYLKEELAKVTNSEIKRASDCSEISKG